MELLSIVVVDVPERPPRIVYLPMTFLRMEALLLSLGLDVSNRYLFQSVNILQRFKVAFRFPEGDTR